MALLEMGGRRFTLPEGEVLLGADAGSAIPLAFPGILPRHAKLKSLPDGQVVITKAVPEAEVLINGVRLGAEPTPLLHGDKVEVGGQELTFVDERRSGSTQYVQAMSVPQAMAQAKAEAKGGKVTVGTGKFGFYAAPAAPPPAPRAAPPPRPGETPKAGPAAGAPRRAAPPPVPPTKGESVKLRETVHGVPAAPRPSGTPLASFLVRGGALKGQRLSVETPVVNIGRADYNDLVIPDESVSTSHAKLQPR